MMLSPGFLHSSHRLLELLESCPISAEDLTDNFQKILLAAPQYVIKISLRCGWVSVNAAGYLVSTKNGLDILSEQDDEVRLCKQIKDYILYEIPSWAGLIPKGRQETLSFLPTDVRQCFFEAGLHQSPPTENIIVWWDELASAARAHKHDILGKIGRNGERLSIRYETARIGQKPVWQSVESNLSGYDLLSRQCMGDDRPLMIEVKASTEGLGNALFHITRNEWETAMLSTGNYVFHLWLLGIKQHKLAIIDERKLLEHVPLENGFGKWESLRVPFKCFENDFKLFE